MKVLLTGSSKGIGYKIAEDLLAEGHVLALHYNKNESPIDALLKKDKTGSFSIQADLSQQEEIKKMVEKAEGKLKTGKQMMREGQKERKKLIQD